MLVLLLANILLLLLAGFRLSVLAFSCNIPSPFSKRILQFRYLSNPTSSKLFFNHFEKTLWKFWYLSDEGNLFEIGVLAKSVEKGFALFVAPNRLDNNSEFEISNIRVLC